MINIPNLLRTCYAIATLSPDPSSQNGAILVSLSNTCIQGMNTFPIHFNYSPSLLTNRDEKLFYIEHAERHVIYAAAREGTTTLGSTLVCPWIACNNCARAIIFAGVAKVICHKQRMDLTSERWKANCDKAISYMIECGVEIEYYDGKLGCSPILVDGELWEPSYVYNTKQINSNVKQL